LLSRQRAPITTSNVLSSSSPQKATDLSSGQPSAESPRPASTAQQQQPAESDQPVAKKTLADWMADDDGHEYFAEKRERGGRKKRRKNKDATKQEQSHPEEEWYQPYDPARATDYHAWMHSEARLEIEREWKEKLYEHRRRPEQRSPSRASSVASPPRTATSERVAIAQSMDTC
jgi:splicing factor 45